jgi:hypothetical protein
MGWIIGIPQWREKPAHFVAILGFDTDYPTIF